MNWINNAIKLADERILSPNFVNNFDDEDPSQKIFSIDQIDEWKIGERFYRDMRRNGPLCSRTKRLEGNNNSVMMSDTIYRRRENSHTHHYPKNFFAYQCRIVNQLNKGSRRRMRWSTNKFGVYAFLRGSWMFQNINSCLLTLCDKRDIHYQVEMCPPWYVCFQK